MEKHQSSFENIVLYSTSQIARFTGTLQHGKHTIAHGHYNYTLRTRPSSLTPYIVTFVPRLLWRSHPSYIVGHVHLQWPWRGDVHKHTHAYMVDYTCNKAQYLYRHTYNTHISWLYVTAHISWLIPRYGDYNDYKTIGFNVPPWIIAGTGLLLILPVKINTYPRLSSFLV